MFCKLTPLAIAFLIAAVSLDVVKAVDNCGDCMDNKAFCVNNKDYYFCNNGNPMSGGLLHCEEDEVCTNDPKICVKTADLASNTAITAPCSEEGACGKCVTGQTFTCVSTTEFMFCPKQIVSQCEAGHVCSIGSKLAPNEICLPECLVGYNDFKTTCSNDVYTTTTTTAAPTPAPDMEALKKKCEAAAASNSSLKIIKLKNDDICKSYLHCEKLTAWEVIIRNCGSNYFDVDAQKCVSTKPATCA